MMQDIQEKHNAILMIVHAIKHGKTTSDIVTEFAFKELSEYSQLQWSNALIGLANEVCTYKNIEITTSDDNCKDLNEESSLLMHGLKLLFSAVENSSISVTEICGLLHPNTLSMDALADSVEPLPTCCIGDRNTTVSCVYIYHSIYKFCNLMYFISQVV